MLGAARAAADVPNIGLRLPKIDGGKQQVRVTLKPRRSPVRTVSTAMRIAEHLAVEGTSTRIELARWLGVTEQRAGHVLLGESRWWTRVGTDERGSHLYELTEAGRKAVGQVRSPPRSKARAEVAAADLERVRRLLDDARIADAARVVARRQLEPRYSLSRLTESQRARFQLELADVISRLRMVAGKPKQALRILRTAAQLGHEARAPIAHRLFATRSAALRMLGPSSLPAGLESLDQAVTAIRWLAPPERRRARRWILSTQAGQLAIVGETSRAGEEWSRAFDLNDDVGSLDGATDLAETLLLGARVRLLAGDTEGGRVLVARAQPIVRNARVWVRAWYHRYAADVASAEGAEAEWATEWSAAWTLTKGHGFQRRLLAARASMLPVLWLRALPQNIRRSLIKVAAAHATERQPQRLRAATFPECARLAYRLHDPLWRRFWV